MVLLKNALKLTEWILFFGLCGFSLAFIWNAIGQYESKDTNFKISEIPIKGIRKCILFRGLIRLVTN